MYVSLDFSDFPLQVRTTDLAALSKQFLRDLPQPLLTNEWVEAFASVERVPERKQQLQALNLLIILLPNVHRDSLKRLLMFLNKVMNGIWQLIQLS